MSSPIIVRRTDDTDIILGMINKATGQSLITSKAPYCAVTVNKFHGFKRQYFKTAKDALHFIHEETK